MAWHVSQTISLAVDKPIRNCWDKDRKPSPSAKNLKVTANRTWGLIGFLKLVCCFLMYGFTSLCNLSNTGTLILRVARNSSRFCCWNRKNEILKLLTHVCYQNTWNRIIIILHKQTNIFPMTPLGFFDHFTANKSKTCFTTQRIFFHSLPFGGQHFRMLHRLWERYIFQQINITTQFHWNYVICCHCKKKGDTQTQVTEPYVSRKPKSQPKILSLYRLILFLPKKLSNRHIANTLSSQEH